MPTIDGAIRALSIDGRPFSVAHDGSGNKASGGRNNETQMNGNGTFRVIQTLVPGSFSDINVNIDDSKGDQEFLKETAENGIPIPVVVTYASGISYTGNVVLTGEMVKDENTGLMTLAFQGEPLQRM